MATKKILPPNLPSRYRDAGKPLLSGGFGEGRILVDEWLDREVLLKTAIDPADRATLDQEVKVVGSVTSKHVVRIFDVIRDATGVCDGIIYEYLPGAVLTPGQFPVGSDLAAYLKVLYQLSTGLADIHGAKFVHRDIKLDNVKADAEGILKIFDFGISSNIGDVTKAGRGTLIYLAPELFKSPARVGSPVDIYASGVCSVALMSSAVPGPLAERPPQSKSRMPSVAGTRPDLPRDLVDLLDRALDVDAAKRPTAADIRNCVHRNLVKDQHRATLIGLDKPVQLNKGNRSTTLRLPGIGEIQLNYNGTNIVATQVSGEVFINNRSITAGTLLYESCVITFGNPERGSARRFVELNCSLPEVVL